MRSVANHDAVALNLIKTLLDAFPPGGGEGVKGEGRAPGPQGKAAPPSAPPPSPRAKPNPGPTPGLDKPASAAPGALAAQMLAVLMVDGEVVPGALTKIGGEGDGREASEASGVKAEEAPPPQPKSGPPSGSIPWPSEALAAYTTRPRELVGLPPEARPSGQGWGGRSDLGSAKPNALKLFQRALTCACVIAALFVLLNRDAFFG